MKKALFVSALVLLAIAIFVIGSILPDVVLPIAHMRDGDTFSAEIGRRVTIALVSALAGIALAAFSKSR